MNSLLRTPGQRILAAILISAIAHALLLWLPNIRLPSQEAPLPLLTAQLVPLPKLQHKPKKRKPKPAPTAQPTQPPTALEPLAASAVVNAASAVAASEVIASTELEAASAIPSLRPDYALSSNSAPPLPKHAQLRFVAYLGTHGINLGEIQHELIIKDDHYELHSVLGTTGLVRLLKRYDNIQTSRGTLTARGGLRPDEFTEKAINGSNTRLSVASFDWDQHQIRFADGTSAMLSDGAQDILSFLYQLSQLPFERGTIPFLVSNGRKLEHYQLEVVGEEDIYTPMGKLHTLHLRKIHELNEEGIEVWLAMEYRLLPVKFRQIERSGTTGGEIVIKEIRVADE